jgi:hypothetical protein
MLFSVLLFSACKSYENIITTDLSLDSYGFYYATQQDSINAQTRLHEVQIKSIAFEKKAKEQLKKGEISDYLICTVIQEASYPGGWNRLHQHILENLILPKEAKEGITKIRIIVDMVDKDCCYAKPEILKYNDKRVKNALIESINKLERNWIPGKIVKEHPYKIDLSLMIKSKKNI